MSLKSLLILNQKIDAVDVPEVGKIHMFLQGTTIKYKDSNNVDYTLATGVSPEDVQDIVGNFIATGSNKLTAVYDDVLNIIILDVDDTKIDHVNLLNKGTNSHAQLDAHVASESNPHNTTAAQVGADPSGTATAAIASHVASPNPHLQYYLATNPSGFETPAQLNARDTANRSRANHTGSQLASTISDFSTAVLSTIIAGVVFTANVSIAATDSVLEAFGKLQAQINYILSVLSTLVIGDNFEQFVDATTFTTTSNVNQVAATFTTATKQVGKYRINVEWAWAINSNTGDGIFGIYLDGVLVSPEFRKEASEVVSQNFPWSWTFYATFASITTHTLELRTRAETNGQTVSVFNVQAEIWRASV